MVTKMVLGKKFFKLHKVPFASHKVHGALDRVAEKLNLSFFGVNQFYQTVYIPALQPN